MNTLISIGLVLCISMAYAMALPSPLVQPETNADLAPAVAITDDSETLEGQESGHWGGGYGHHGGYGGWRGHGGYYGGGWGGRGHGYGGGWGGHGYGHRGGWGGGYGYGWGH